MKRHRGGRISVLIALLIWSIAGCVAASSAQERGSMSGIVLTLDGAPLNDARLTLSPVGKTANKADLSTVSDGQGKFSFSPLQPAEYILTLSHRFFGPKIQRTVSLTNRENLELTLYMGKACMDIPDGKAEAVTALDKAEIVNAALDEALVRLLPVNGKMRRVILPTKNVDVAWLAQKKSVSFDLMSPEMIQQRADQAGDFSYLRLSEFSSTGACVAISIELSWAVAKTSSTVYLGGAGISFEFRKQGGKWSGEKVLEWVS